MGSRNRKSVTVRGVASGFGRGDSPLVVATDAAVKGRRAGLGWLSTTGFFGALGHYYPFEYSGPDETTIAELRAVAYAWDHIDPTGPITILVDSRAALTYLNGWLGGDNAMPASYQSHYRMRRDGTPALVRLARSIVIHGPVTVEWTEGHVGHPLNEGADSLAKLAVRADLTGAAAARTCEQIARNRIGDWRLPQAQQR